MGDNNDYGTLIIFLIMGPFIALGYGKMIFLYSKQEQEALWSNNGRNNIENYKLKNVYIFMILLSVISGIYLMYYLTTTPAVNFANMIMRFVGLSLFLFLSVIWAHEPFIGSKFVLFGVAAGAVLLLTSMCLEKNDGIAIAAMTELIVQTLLFDAVLWTGII